MHKITCTIMYCWASNIQKCKYILNINVRVQRRKVEAKLYWAKEMTTDGKEIIITMYCWACNINICNMYNNNTAKRGKGYRTI